MIKEREIQRDGPETESAGTEGYDIVDQEVLEHVRLRLREQPGIDASRIWITHDNDITTLSGTVLAEETRQKAEEVARKVAEVKDLRNLLTVAHRGFGDQPPAA